MNPRERLQYALYLQRLHDLFVIKENIAFEYQHKNYNKAAKQIDIAVDKMLHDNVVNAVEGTVSLKDPKLDHIIEEALTGQQNMLVKNPDHYIRNAVEQNTKQFSNFLQNRIEKENYSLQKKIQEEYDKRKNEKISDEQLKKEIKEKFLEHGRKRAKNIVKDALHTNQAHMSWVSSREGYKYKVWMNGQSKSGVRYWHVRSKIQPVEIDDFFDIFGPTGHASMMYPGDLNGGAENVANCKCWLYYTNIAPSNLKPRGTIQINPNVQLENENATTFSANTETKGKTTKSNSNKSTSSNEKGLFKKIKTRISKIGEKIKTAFSSKNHKSYLSSKKSLDDERVIIEERNGTKFKDYRNVPDDFDEHMENIQKDVKYESKHINATIDYGGDIWYKSINDYCYKNESLEKNMKENGLTIKDVQQKIRDLDETIEISPGLDDNYVLWKGGDSRGINLTPGEKNKWAAYSSTSANKGIGEDYYEDAKERIKNEGLDKKGVIPLLFKIRAKTGTKGVYMDKNLQGSTGEYEFLLGRDQEFITIDSYPNPDNPEMMICEIELI